MQIIEPIKIGSPLPVVDNNTMCMVEDDSSPVEMDIIFIDGRWLVMAHAPDTEKAILSQVPAEVVEMYNMQIKKVQRWLNEQYREGCG